jgi:hypothetical protein
MFSVIRLDKNHGLVRALLSHPCANRHPATRTRQNARFLMNLQNEQNSELNNLFQSWHV